MKGHIQREMHVVLAVILTLLAACQPVQLSKKLDDAPPAPYVIGPEDVLNVYVWKEETLSRTVPVRVDGKISLPLVNELQAAGLTPPQLQEIVVEKLKDYIADPVVTVIVMESNSFKVSVSGEVKTPGTHRLRSDTSLLQIISMAGGFTEWANQKKILVIRREDGKEVRMTVNYKQMVSGKVPVLSVKPGDTIIVP
jgi:polysaccharide biosynthesis/export protein